MPAHMHARMCKQGRQRQLVSFSFFFSRFLFAIDLHPAVTGKDTRPHYVYTPTVHTRSTHTRSTCSSTGRAFPRFQFSTNLQLKKKKLRKKYLHWQSKVFRNSPPRMCVCVRWINASRRPTQPGRPPSHSNLVAGGLALAESNLHQAKCSSARLARAAAGWSRTTATRHAVRAATVHRDSGGRMAGLSWEWTFSSARE